MRTSRSRLLALLLVAPLLLLILASTYVVAMGRLEGETRTLGEAVQWAAETLTTTGYGSDDHWEHPLMIAFVVVTQFVGLALTFVVFTLVVVPFFEERFEGKLPRDVPKLRDFVLVFRYGPAVVPLLEELERANVKTVVLETDETVARRVLDRGRTVVFVPDEDELEGTLFSRARAVVLAGSDQENAAMVLSARQLGYEGDLLALADRPLHRRPMMLAGATAVYTPLHILAAAMASLARDRVRPRLVGMGHVRGHLNTTELRVAAGSELDGTTLAESKLRSRTGATVVGCWADGSFTPYLDAHERIDAGTILVAVGSDAAVEKLGKLATPLRGEGPFVVCGGGEVGSKVAELLRDADEQVVVLDRDRSEGVDVVGDVLEQGVLASAGAKDARCVVLALGNDSTTLFAASVVRDYAPDVPIVARVDRMQSVGRLHRAGADFALSLGEVAAELLAQQMLGDEWISLDARVKLHEVSSGGLQGRSPFEAQVGAETGCAIVAVRRGDEVTVDFPDGFQIEAGDAVYLAAPPEALERFFARYPKARPS